jgi:dihydrofolate reductase
VHGSGALLRWLLDNDLVDEMNLLIVPVVLSHQEVAGLRRGPPGSRF